jgi:O-antigen/teichoic acid export membrane protein
MMVGFPAAVGIFAIAHLFVPTVLGEQWQHIVPLVKWFALASLMMMGMSGTQNVLIALARMKWSTAIIAFKLILMVIFLLWLLPIYGVLGVAYAAVLSMLCVLVLCYIALRVNIRLGLRRAATLIYKPAMSSMVMLIMLQALFPRHWVESGVLIQVLQLTGAVVSGAICYCLVLGSLWLLVSRPEGPELTLLRLIHNRSGFGGFLLPGGKQHA